jgi:copper chaperone NosL
MKNSKAVLLLCGLLAIYSCNTEPQPINYGSDLCEFCHMTISDRKFATELVNDRGRTYKFDCIECMIRYKKKNFTQDQLRMELVSNYLVQKDLLNAHTAAFLKCESFPSPMGEGLSAYSSLEELNRVKQQYGGKNYSWKELNEIVK